MADPDLSEFETSSSRRHSRCIVARHLEALSPEDRITFLAALGAAHISHSAIAKVFSTRGLRIGHDSVRVHRNESCCCER